jgi:hypothetical protein
MQAITGALSARVRPAVLLLAAAIALALAWAESAAASTAYSAVSAQPRPIPWTGWNGRPIQRPRKPVDEALLSKAAFPVGWSAGAARYGTGYHRLGGSERVREVQRRLTRLGYHTGPVDGLYGPLTRSAVQWFQIKHGLRPTGVVAAATLVALRDPRGFMRQPDAQAKEPALPSGQPFTSTPTKERHPAPRESDGVPAWLVPALLAALAAALSTALLMFSRPALKLAHQRLDTREPGPRRPGGPCMSAWPPRAAVRARAANRRSGIAARGPQGRADRPLCGRAGHGAGLVHAHRHRADRPRYWARHGHGGGQDGR